MTEEAIDHYLCKLERSLENYIENIELEGIRCIVDAQLYIKKKSNLEFIQELIEERESNNG